MKNFKLLILFVLFFLTNSIYAKDFTVTTVAELTSALSEAQDNGEDDNISISAGTYYFSNQLSFDSDENNSLTLLGNGTVIFDGQKSTRIFDINLSGAINIENITFQNGKLDSDHGGAISVINSSDFVVTNSIFKDNNCTRYYGGAIYMKDNNSTVLIDNTSFIKNDGRYGGAIYIADNSENIVIKNSTFTNNYSTSSEGDINILRSKNVLIENLSTTNTAVDGNSVFYCQYGDNLTIKNSMFNNNGVYIRDIENVLIENSTFKNHVGKTAIKLVGGVNSSVKNSTFDKNTLQSIYANSMNTSIEDSSFISNYEGQAIRAFGCKNFIVKNSLFKNHKYTGRGGAISSSSNTNVLIENSTFTDNETTWDGGAIYFTDGRDNNANIKIKNSTFTNNKNSNTSGYAGAIAFKETRNMLIEDSLFTGNEGRYGGAIYLYNYDDGEDDGEMYLSIKDTTFQYNKARTPSGYYDGDGGAIRAHYYTFLSIENSAFIGNQSSNAGDGGALSLYAGDSASIKNSTFTNNTSLDDGGSGGAISFTTNIKDDNTLMSDNNVSIEDSNFTSNQSDSAGGAIHGWKSKNVLIKNSNFTNNSGGVGGILFSNVNYALIENSNFNNNKSTWNGGAINFYGDSQTTEHRLDIFNSRFYGNSSKKGGAIDVYSGKVNIANSYLGKNSASERGGGVHSEQYATVTFLNSILHSNTSALGKEVYSYGFNNFYNTLFISSPSTNRIHCNNYYNTPYIKRKSTNLSNNDVNGDPSFSTTENIFADLFFEIDNSNIPKIKKGSLVLGAGHTLKSLKSYISDYTYDKMLETIKSIKLDENSQLNVGTVYTSRESMEIDLSGFTTNKDIRVYTDKPIDLHGNALFTSYVAGIDIPDSASTEVNPGEHYGTVTVKTNGIYANMETIEAKNIYNTGDKNVRYNITDITGGKYSGENFLRNSGTSTLASVKTSCYGTGDECKLASFHTLDSSSAVQYRWEKQLRFNLESSMSSSPKPTLKVTRQASRDDLFGYYPFTVQKLNTEFRFNDLAIFSKEIDNQTLLTLGESEEIDRKKHLQVYIDRVPYKGTRTIEQYCLDVTVTTHVKEKYLSGTDFDKMEILAREVASDSRTEHCIYKSKENYDVFVERLKYDLKHFFDNDEDKAKLNMYFEVTEHQNKYEPKPWYEYTPKYKMPSDVKSTDIPMYYTTHDHSGYFEDPQDLRNTSYDVEEIFYNYYIVFAQKSKLDSSAEEIARVKLDDSQQELFTNGAKNDMSFSFVNSAGNINLKFRLNGNEVIKRTQLDSEWFDTDFVGRVSLFKTYDPAISKSGTRSFYAKKELGSFKVFSNGEEISYESDTVEESDEIPEVYLQGFGEYWITEGDKVELFIPNDANTSMLALDKLTHSDEYQNSTEINVEDIVTEGDQEHYWVDITNNMNPDLSGDFTIDYNLKTYQFETEIGEPFTLNYAKLDTEPDLTDRRKVVEQIPDFLLKAILNSHKPIIFTPLEDNPPNSTEVNSYIYTTRMPENQGSEYSEEINTSRELYKGTIYFTRPGRYLLEWFVDSNNENILFNPDDGIPKLKVEVNVKWPLNVDIKHIAETPDIVLDASQNDDVYFKGLKLSERFESTDRSSRVIGEEVPEIKVQNMNVFSFPTWTSKNEEEYYRSVLVFTKSLDENVPATGDINNEEIIIKTVESRHWSNGLKEETTTIGTEITSPEHHQNTPHNGYLFVDEELKNIRYNVNTYVPETMQGEIFAVNEERVSNDGIDDIIIAWYQDHYDINLFFPYTTTRYHAEYPEPSETDRIVVASRFGSDGLSSKQSGYNTNDLNITVSISENNLSSTFYDVNLTSYFNANLITQNSPDEIEYFSDFDINGEDSFSRLYKQQFYTSESKNENSLPSNGVFRKNDFHETVNLNYATVSGDNLIQFTPTKKTAIKIDIENSNYKNVHLYGFSTWNSGNSDVVVKLKLYYSDGSTEYTDSQYIHDWVSNLDDEGGETKEVYYLTTNLDTIKAQNSEKKMVYANDKNRKIFGFRFDVNSEKELDQIELIPYSEDFSEAEEEMIFILGASLEKEDGVLRDKETLFTIGSLFGNHDSNLQVYGSTSHENKSEITLNFVSHKNGKTHNFTTISVDKKDLEQNLTFNFNKDLNTISVLGSENNLIAKAEDVILPDHFKGSLFQGKVGKKNFTVPNTKDFDGGKITVQIQNNMEYERQLKFDNAIYSDLTVYNQPDKTQAGYNPNEEHALVTKSFRYSSDASPPKAVYALQNTLNQTNINNQNYTSEPFVLAQYFNKNLNKYEMKIYSIEFEDNNTFDNHYLYSMDKNADGVIDSLDGDDSFNYTFNYPIYAGDKVVAPYPLNEIIGANTIRETRGENVGNIRAYWQDKNSNSWVVAGGAEIKTYFWYPMLKEFWHPTAEEGDILPFATNSFNETLKEVSKNSSEYYISDGENFSSFNDEIAVTYQSYWKTGIPEIRLGETITFQGGEEKKDDPSIDGMPSAIGWASAEVVFDSLNPTGDVSQWDNNFSVKIHPAVREISIAIENFPDELLPATGLTKNKGGKYFFTELHAGLKQRIYFDSMTRKLYFRGALNDKFAGDTTLTVSPNSYNYILQPNIMSNDDLQNLLNLKNINSELEIAFTKLYALSQNPTLTEFNLTNISDSTYQPEYKLALSKFLRGRDNQLIAKVEPASVFGVGGADEDFLTQLISEHLPSGKLPNGLTIEDIELVYPKDLPFGYSVQDPILKNKLDSGYKLLKIKDGKGYIPNSQLGSGLAIFTNPNLAENRDFNNSFVVIAENNDFAINGSPIQLHIFKVNNRPYRGQIKTVLSENVFDEKITLRHTGDFGGNFNDLVFEWQYRETDGVENPPYLYNDPSCSEETNISATSASSGWNIFVDDRENLPNDYVDGQGRYELVFGKTAGAQILTDNSFYVRYRHKNSDANDSKSWSGWAGSGGNNPCSQPVPVYKSQLVKGWVKRVTDRVNVYDARINDFGGDSAPADYVSMIQQIGSPYVGDIALNPDKDVIENYGMSEIYETVLNRAKDLSIDAAQPVSSDGVIQAIQNAGSRIAQFYTLLGNEAYTDALDPTIGFTTESNEYGNLAPNIFTFMNQMATLSDEELALLRGKEGSVEGDTGAMPTHNRLIWNFTNSDGEAAYALSYNISDKNSDGFIDYEDAKIMYPQGHGDAWGHYLSALKTYYDLLNHPQFTWVARAESYEIDGQTFKIDYLDERRFAEASAYKAKAGAEIVDLTYRNRYVEDPEGQWQGYKDTESYRAWGVDGWAKRTHIASYMDWAVANAMLPAEDTNRTGIEKIDRTTVAELQEIAIHGNKIITKMSEINSGLNPLGLLPDVVPFDIEPATDESHFEQIYSRAIDALINAKNVFDYANDLKHRIREVADTQQEFSQEVLDRDNEFRNQLIEYYGTPYEGTIGAGKTYPEGYSGPDVYFYQYIDVADVTGESFPEQDQNLVTYLNNINLGETDKNGQEIYQQFFASDMETGFALNTNIPEVASITYPLNTGAKYMFSAPSDWGERKFPGKIQEALLEVVKADIDARLAEKTYTGIWDDLRRIEKRMRIQEDFANKQIEIVDGTKTRVHAINRVINVMETYINSTELIAETISDAGEVVVEALPKVVGLSTDVTAPARATIKGLSNTSALILKGTNIAVNTAISELETQKEIHELNDQIKTIKAENDFEQQQLLTEIDQIFNTEPEHRLALFKAREVVRQAVQKYRSLLGEAIRLQDERIIFNKRVASKTQTNRYKDMAFRINQTSASQKYRTAFDLASKYAYLTAKAYDYETNLSPDHPASAQHVLQKIVQERVLGQINIDSTGVNLVIGQGGLADTLARMKENFDVLKTQMGFNNPQTELAPFSLRRELFRIKEQNNENWRKTLAKYYVPDLWEIPEFRTHMRPFAKESFGKQPALVIPFSSEIISGKNFFGHDLGSGDHAYDSSQFSTRIKSVGIWLENYQDLGLAETARAYLVPIGQDIMLIPDSDELDTREWNVKDQKIPVPMPMGKSDIEDSSWSAQKSLNGEAEIRRHSQIRVYHDSGEVDSSQMQMDSRLFGRSVWNSKWVLVISGASLLNPAEDGINTLIHGKKLPNSEIRDGNGISDIKLIFSTYSYSGN